MIIQNIRNFSNVIFGDVKDPFAQNIVSSIRLSTELMELPFAPSECPITYQKESNSLIFTHGKEIINGSTSYATDIYKYNIATNTISQYATNSDSHFKILSDMTIFGDYLMPRRFLSGYQPHQYKYYNMLTEQWVRVPDSSFITSNSFMYEYEGSFYLINISGVYTFTISGGTFVFTKISNNTTPGATQFISKSCISGDYIYIPDNLNLTTRSFVRFNMKTLTYETMEYTKLDSDSTTLYDLRFIPNGDSVLFTTITDNILRSYRNGDIHAVGELDRYKENRNAIRVGDSLYVFGGSTDNGFYTPLGKTLIRYDLK